MKHKIGDGLPLGREDEAVRMMCSQFVGEPGQTRHRAAGSSDLASELSDLRIDFRRNCHQHAAFLTVGGHA